MRWALVQVREASIDHHATDKPPAGLDDPPRCRPARAHLPNTAASICHGAPGVNWAKFSEGLKPDPPDLKDVVGELTPSQLFWVIKNGINMTGMPSFKLAGVKDDDIWLIVAFVKKLPKIKEADYKAWTAPPAAAAPAPGPAPPKP